MKLTEAENGNAKKELNSEDREFLDTWIKKKVIFSCSLPISIR
jgi:hypothetical protein